MPVEFFVCDCSEKSHTVAHACLAGSDASGIEGKMKPVWNSSVEPFVEPAGGTVWSILRVPSMKCLTISSVTLALFCNALSIDQRSFPLPRLASDTHVLERLDNVL